MSLDDTRDATIDRKDDDPGAITGRALGDFVVREKIGQGAFGAVYRADQALLGREAVVKVLHARHLRQEQKVQRFLREAKLASRLDHPYAAHIYAFGAEQDGLLWIAMELVRGITLEQLIRDKGPLPLARFVPLFEHLCEVVQTAHELGIVHRDLKPANIMVLTRAGRLLPKLLDLGIAKGAVEASQLIAVMTPVDLPTDDGEASATADTMRPTLTQDGALIGSPSYMAPEQWVNGEVGAAADLYALAAVAYEALTGKVLFDASTVQAIARKHAKGVVPPLGDTAPPALHAVLKKALSRDPAGRYHDATSFARALREAGGVGEAADNLPRLSEAVRDPLLTDAPQPIAECVAALEAARGPHPLLDAVWQTFAVSLRYLGLVAAAAASRTELAQAALPDDAVQLLGILRKRGLSDEEWLDLARELCRPFAARHEAHPLPELVSLFFSIDAKPRQLQRAEALLQLQSSTRGEQLERLGEAVSDLSGLLGELGFLSDYHLAVRRGDKLENWTGVRRQHRTGVAVPSAELPEGQALLLSPDGAPVLALWPLFQVATPTPGAPEELFLVEGQSRHGPRLIALPQGFERRDPELWDHLRLRLSAGEPAGRDGERERAPYRGLDGFTRDDVGLFFGRERESEAVANRLRVQALVAIVGPSGAGKSSFVQAGLLPLLPESWRAITIRPGHDPMGTLLARLGREGMSPQVLEAALRSDRATLYYELERIAGTGTVVLVIDQFEEVFTLCEDAAVRAAFCEAVVRAAPSLEARVRVVLTMRDDFLLRAESEPALRERLSQGLQLLTTPVAAELQRILIEPARAVGYDFEDRGLAAEMVEAVAGQPGALPLLSFTAAKLWEQRDRHFKQLRRRAYESLGKVGGALAQHAEEVMAGLTTDEQRLVRELFRHLVTAEGTRAVMSRQELGQILGAGHGDKVLERLIAARLLSAREGEDRAEQIEVVHEALLSAWPRLGEWRREDAEGARIRDQLRAAARQWDQRGRPRGMLWRGEALAELELWRKRHHGGLTAVDDAFAQASTADAVRGRRRLRAAVLLAFALLASGLVALGRANARAKSSAEIAADRLTGLYEQTGRKAFLDGQPQQALVYLSEAYSRGRRGTAIRFLIARAFEALAPLQRMFSEAGERVTYAAFDAKASRVVTAADDGTVRLWGAFDGALLRTLPPRDGALAAIGLFADGERLLSLAANGTLKVQRLADGEVLTDIPHAASRPRGAVIAPDGAHVLVADADAAVLWDVERHKVTSRFAARSHGGAVAFSGDGRRLLTTNDDGSIVLWDVGASAAVRRFPDASNSQAAGAFDPTGKLAALPGGSGAALLLVDAERGTTRWTTTAHRRGISSVGFSAKGDRIVTVGFDRVIRIWDTRTGRQLAELGGNSGPLNQARFTEDDTQILSTSEDGTVRLWDLGVGSTSVILHDHAGAILSYKLQGTWVLTLSSGGGAKLWDLRRSLVIASLPHASPLADARFVGSDRIATLDMEGTWRLWDPAHAAAPLTTERTQALGGLAAIDDGGHIAAALDDGVAVWRAGAPDLASRLPIARPSSLLLSPEGSRLLAATEAGQAAIWQVAERRPVPLADGVLRSAAISPDGGMFALARAGSSRVQLVRASGQLGRELDAGRGSLNALNFSGDGAHLIAAASDNRTHVFDLSDGREAAVFTHESSIIASAALSRDGALAAIGTNDGVVQMWDVASGRMLLDRVSHGGTIFSTAFSADDQRLLTTGAADGTARIWNVAPTELQPDEVAARVRCEVRLTLTRERVVSIDDHLAQRCTQTAQK